MLIHDGRAGYQTALTVDRPPKQQGLNFTLFDPSFNQLIAYNFDSIF